MPNQLVRALGPLVTQPAFRTDAARFLSLPSCSVNRLVSLVEEHATFNVPPGDLHEFEMACNLKGQGRQVLAAARVIRSAVEGIDQKELRDRALTDFASQLEVESFAVERFSSLLSPLPRLEAQDVRSAAIALAPTMVNTQLYSDLRVIPEAPGTGIQLVPVVVARLEFDEPVAGQEALFIQLTEESFAELKRQVERMEKTLQAIRDRFGDQIIAGNDA
jgi:hypothetical protein